MEEEKKKNFKNNKTFFLIDETYNSNPHSLEHAILNANKL